MDTETDSADNSQLSRILFILIGTTLFEVAGLIAWIEFDARGQSGLGLIILFIGLVLERLVVFGIPKTCQAPNL